MNFKIINLGCKVNSYECSALHARFLELGMTEANESEEPDVIVINTCSVTQAADKKSRQKIRAYKSTFPNAIICVMGCYAQGNSEFIANEIGADIVVGTSNRAQIPELIMNFKNNNKVQINMTEDKPRFFSYEELGVTSCSENIRAYLKIQDGCNNFCSYCVIPYRRGKSRSRAKDDILKEARYLVSAGYKEIVLTGIDVSGYGKDLDGVSLGDLVEEISNIDGLYRVRISSIEESEMGEKLIELCKSKDNIAKHLHIPLQSGSETVLKRMNRKYDCESFLKTLQHIRKEIPNVALTTDVIVGFPGETEEEFNETYQFIKACGFNMLHVFPYSQRPGTVAARMKNQIDPQIKKERVHKLLELSNNLWDNYCSRFKGKEVEVLVEEYDEETKSYVGHTTNYLKVHVKSDTDISGKIIKTIYKS